MQGFGSRHPNQGIPQKTRHAKHMESNLIPGHLPLTVDGEISAWLEFEIPQTRPGRVKTIGIRSKAGPVYRIIKATGSEQWVRCLAFLGRRLRLELELDEAGLPPAGFDAVFRPRRSIAGHAKPSPGIQVI
jgi:hypothetical protein